MKGKTKLNMDPGEVGHAYGATNTPHMFVIDEKGTLVYRGAIDNSPDAEGESPENGNFSPKTLGGATVRMILTVADPDAAFARALSAGASPVFAVMEEYGWRLGRIVDPFGHHWEIGRPLTAQ